MLLSCLVEDLQNKVNQSSNSQSFGVNFTSNSNLTIAPEQFYKKRNDSYLGHVGLPTNDRSQLQASRYMQYQQQKSFHPTYGTRSQTVPIGSPTINRNRIGINATHCNSISSQLAESSVHTSQSMHKPVHSNLFNQGDMLNHNSRSHNIGNNNLASKITNTQCSLIGSTVPNDSDISNNRAKRINDDQESTFSQHFQTNYINNQPALNLNSKNNDVSGQQMMDFNHFRKPYDVQVQSAGQHSSLSRVDRSQYLNHWRFQSSQCSNIENSVTTHYNNTSITLRPAMPVASNCSTVQEINKELSAIMSMINSLSAGERTLNRVQTLITQIKKAFQNDIGSSCLSNTSSVPALPIEELQFMQPAIGPVTNHPAQKTIEFQPQPNNGNAAVSTDERQKRKINSKSMMSPVKNLKRLKQISPKQGIKEIKTLRDISAKNEDEISKRRSLSNSSQNATKDKATTIKTRNKCVDTKILSEIPNNNPSTKAIKKADSKGKENIENVGKRKSVLNRNNKETMLLEEAKTKKKTTATNVEKPKQKIKNIDDLNETSQEESTSKNNCGQSKGINSYVSSRGRVVKPTTQYWLKKKLGQNDTISTECDVLPQVKTTSNNSNISKLNVSLRERKQLTKKQEKEKCIKTAVKNNKPEPVLTNSTQNLKQSKSKVTLKNIGSDENFNNTTRGNGKSPSKVNKSKEKKTKENVKSPSKVNKSKEKKTKENVKSPSKVNISKEKKTKENVKSPSKVNKSKEKKTKENNKSFSKANKCIEKKTKENDKSPSKINKCIEKNTKKKPAPKEKDNENLPIKVPKKGEKLQTEETKKQANAKGRKRKNDQQDESVSVKKKKKDTEYKNGNGYPFDSSLKLFESHGSSKMFCFGASSPGEALNSIRKKTDHISGRETPPTKYLCSFLDHTGNTKSPSVVSGDEQNNPVKSHVADRVTKKMNKAKNSKKQVKRKSTSKVEENENPVVTEVLNQVLYGKGKKTKKVEDIFRTKLTLNAHGEDSFDSWCVESEYDSDNYEDLK